MNTYFKLSLSDLLLRLGHPLGESTGGKCSGEPWLANKLLQA